MGTRRAARELALQALYQLDVAGAGDPGVALFWSHLDAERAEVHPGASEARGARSARALDGPPGEFDRPASCAYKERHARSPRPGPASRRLSLAPRGRG